MVMPRKMPAGARVPALAWIAVCCLLLSLRAIAADGPPAGQFTQVDDLRVHYHDFGQGTPVVLLHGAFDSSRLWLPVGQILGKCHRIVIPDMRGRGLTPDGEGPITSGRLARDTIGLMDRLGIRSAHVVGHSAGSMTLLSMLVDYPDRVVSATLTGSPAMAIGQATSGEANPLVLLRADLVRLREGQAPVDPVLANFRDRWVREAPEPARFRIMIGKLVDGLSASYPPSAAAGKAPILVVRAGHDDLIPREAFTALAEVVQAKRVVDYPEGTHQLPRQQAAALAADIESFITGVEPSACGGAAPGHRP